MIKRLVLQGFRNYNQLDLNTEALVNVFIGENGQGKTNLLEAVFFLSMLRSFRTSQIKDIKQIGSKGFYIGAELLNTKSWSKFIEVEYLNNRKLKIDSSNVSRASDFIRQVKAVAFSPDDILIVQGNSGIRRRFMDMFISMVKPEYLSSLSDYMVALKSRNTVLRSGKRDVGVLKAYESVMVSKGVEVVNYRKDYLTVLKNEIRELLKEFHGANFTFDIRYRMQSGLDSVETYMKRFDSERDREVLKGFTSFGPQLDDFDLIYNSKMLKNFGSTGQCRLVSLCLKMAKLNILISNTGNSIDKGITVLVDDVTGELDTKTKNSFYRVINRADQVFFTFTEKPSDDYFKDARFYGVEKGTIKL